MPCEPARLQRRHQRVHSEAQGRGRAAGRRTRPAGRRRRRGGTTTSTAFALRRHAGAGRPRRAAPAPRRAGRTELRSASAAACACRPALRACARVSGTEAHGVAGRELAQLPQLGLHHHGRADEAAQAGAVGPEDHRHVAGEVDRADRIGVVVDVGRMQARLAAVACAPSAAWARSGARRCGWSCSAPPSRWRRSVSMSAGVKKSGAPCGP